MPYSDWGRPRHASARSGGATVRPISLTAPLDEDEPHWWRAWRGAESMEGTANTYADALFAVQHFLDPDEYAEPSERGSRVSSCETS